ncbi:MAG TPA: anti-sigma factor [Gemmatimonadaceae bacterium]|nr:anti-sigma factor [Gemmatimonadaceae bacterium]
MRCDHCREALDAYLDDELTPDERRESEAHLATCAVCEREHASLVHLRTQVKEHLVRYAAPDVLKARLRADVARLEAVSSAETSARLPWRGIIAACLVIAVASSAATFAIMRGGAGGGTSPSVSSELVASHIRSLMPGHLTDVVSSNQHNVKPWFNGRVDMSPAVPDLSAAGFALIGGRLDYVRGRAVPVIVYARRQHVINVYEWPSPERPERRTDSANGYHLIEWSADGTEYWAVSDLNVAELDQFVKAFAG